MSSKIKSSIEHFLVSSMDEPCLIYDDANIETKVTLKELQCCVETIGEKLEKCFEEENVADEETNKVENKITEENYKIRKEFEVSEEKSIVGVAFNVDSKNVLGFVPSIFATILNQKSFFSIDPNSQTWIWIENAIRDLGIRMIFCDDRFIQQLQQNTNLLIDKVVKIDDRLFEVNILILSRTFELCPNPFSDLIYVVQTSGTSGTRKTVFVSERSIWPNVDDFDRIFDLKSFDKIFAASPPTFDPFYVDLFLWISKKSILIFVPTRLKCQSSILSEILFERQKVSFLQITPTLYKSLSNNLEEILTSTENNFIKYIVMGGEMFPTISSTILSKSSTKFFNVYGVTEMSCWQTMTQVKQSSHENGSQPIFNILDKSSQLLTETDIRIVTRDGEEINESTLDKSDLEGEIVLASLSRFCSVVTNFSNRKARQTNIDSPFQVRTKDLAKVKTNGDVILIGRSDDVLKFEGKRTSLSEIEKSVEKLIQKRCVALNVESNKVVVFVVDESEHFSSQHYLEQLIKNLPSHLIPQKVIQLSCLPMTLNGKIDRERLIAMLDSDTLKRKTLDETSREILFELWTKYLRMLPGEDDKFVEQGGDSHLAVLLSQDLEDRTGQLFPDLVQQILNHSFKEVKIFLEDKEDKSQFHNSEQKRPKLFSSNGIEAKFRSEMSSQVEFATRGKSLGNLEISEKTTKVQLCWKVDLSKCIDATPLVVKTSVLTLHNVDITQSTSHVVFVGSHSGIFVAVDLESGDEIWRRKFPDRIEGSPAVSFCGKFVFVGCYDCRLYSLNVNDGSTCWSFETSGMIKCLPCITDNSVIFGSYDKSVYSVDIQTGNQIFKTEMKASILTTPIMVGKSRIFVSTLNGQCCLLEQDTGQIVLEIDLKAPVFSSPLLAGSLIFVITVKGTLFALDLNTYCSTKFSLDVGSPVFSSISISNGNIFFGCHDRHLYCVDARYGKIRWKVLHSSTVFPTPCPFKSSFKDFVASLSTDGLFKLIDSSNGSTIFEQKFFAEKESYFSSPVIVGTKIVFGCRDNFLYCFDLLSSAAM